MITTRASILPERIAVFGLLLLLSFPCLADTSSANDDTSATLELETAQTQLERGQAVDAIATLVRLRARGGLSSKLLARTYVLQGIARTLREQTDASHAFAVALRLDPTSAPGVEDRAVQALFDKVSRSLPPTSDTLAATATLRGQRGGVSAGMRIELLADDLELVHGVTVNGDTYALSADKPVCFAPTEKKTDIAAFLIDEFGNQLVTVPLVKPSSAPNQTPAAPDDVEASLGQSDKDPWLGSERLQSARWDLEAWPWLTLVGALVGTAGLAVVVSSGAAIAILDRNLNVAPELSPIIQPALYGTLGLGAVIIVVGGATIAADHLIETFFTESEPKASTSKKRHAPEP